MKTRWKIAQFFEAWWWRRYLARQSSEDYLEWKRQYWSRFLETGGIVPRREDRILDAGCGPAGIFMMFPENKVVAVDPLLEKYRQNLPGLQHGNFSNTTLLCMPLEQFQPAERFQWVFCLNAINHVSALDVCLDKLRESLAPGGQLVLTVDAHNHGILKRLFRLFPGDILHPHQFDLEEYGKKLERAGFRIQRTLLLDRQFIFNYYLILAGSQ